MSPPAPNLSKDTSAPRWKTGQTAIGAAAAAVLAAYDLDAGPLAFEILLYGDVDFEICDTSGGQFVPVGKEQWFSLPAQVGPANLWAKAAGPGIVYYIVLGG